MADERLDFELRLIDKFTRASKGIDKSLVGINKTLNVIAKNTGLRKLDADAKRATKGINSLAERGDKLISLSANLNLAASSMQQLSRQSAALFLAPIKEAAEFEKSMSAVKAVTSDFNEEQRTLARELGRTTKFTAKEAAEGMFELSKAGFNASEQMAAIGSVLNLDAAAGMDNLGESAEIVSDIMNGFNIEASKTGGAADVLTTVFTNSAVTLRNLGQTMSFVAPIATQLGVPLKEAAVLAGALGDAGIKGTRGGTALRLIMTQLAGATPKAAKALAALEIKTEDASKNLRPVGDILADISEKFKTLGSAERIRLATDIFGRIGATPGLQLLSDMADSKGSIDKLRKATQQVDGATKDVAETMQDNLLGDVVKVDSAFSALKTTIGDLFTPELRKMSQVMAKETLPGIEEWVTQNKTLVKVLGGTLAVVSAVTAALAGLAITMSSITLVFGGAAKGAAILKGAWLAVFGGVNIAAMIGLLKGLGLALQGVAVTASGFVVAGFKTAAVAIGGSLVALSGAVVAATAAWTLAIVFWWNDIKTLVAGIPSSFLELGANMAQGLIDGWKSIFSGGVEQFMIDNVTGMVDSIKSLLGIASPSKVMMGIGQNMAEGLAIGASGGSANVPGRMASNGAAAATGGGAGRGTVVFRPTVNVTAGGGGEGASAESIGAGVVDALQGMWEDALASQGG